MVYSTTQSNRPIFFFDKSDKSLIERATKAQDKIPLHFLNREPLLSFYRLTVLKIRSALELGN